MISKVTALSLSIVCSIAFAESNLQSESLDVDPFPNGLNAKEWVEGDFNHDGINDLAFLLYGGKSVIDQRSGERVNVDGLWKLGICHGMSDTETAESFNCISIDPPEGFRFWSGTPEYSTWQWGHFGPFTPYVGADCNRRGEQLGERKILMLDEHLGHCSTLMFPVSKSQYHACVYCAD